MIIVELIKMIAKGTCICKNCNEKIVRFNNPIHGWYHKKTGKWFCHLYAEPKEGEIVKGNDSQDSVIYGDDIYSKKK